MLLHQLEAGEMAVVDAIHTDGVLRSRLRSLGIVEEGSLCIRRFGPFGATLQVMTESSFVALRKSEAACIEVNKIV
ncbi:MAG TPA: ferrous iron transport protein A [Campylobacteraceae bacterium]|nr:ferrous iron transport protein A [Campylobacteraceae bacterium]